MTSNSVAKRRRYVSAACWTGLLLLNAILGVRLTAAIWGTETAASMVAVDSWNATGGWVGLERTPVGERMPKEQAHFWLRETQRMAKRSPESASIAMGAALMLDSPDTAFFQHLMTQDDHMAQWRPQIAVKLDTERAAKEIEKFERVCHRRCVVLAARATELESDNPHWWRLRAQLLFNYSLYDDTDLVPRADDWRAVLEECKRHDPENALYDYFLAVQLWQNSGRREWTSEEHYYDEYLTIHDEEQFAAGNAAFDAGIDKPFLLYGDERYGDVLEFLDNSRVLPAERPSLAASRQIVARAQELMIEVDRWQARRADQASDDGRVDMAIELTKQRLRMREQLLAGGEILSIDPVSLSDSRRACLTLTILADEHDIIGPQQRDTFEAMHHEAYLDYKVLTTAAQRVAQNSRAQGTNVAEIAWALTAQVTQAAAGLALMVALLACVVHRLLGRGGPPRALLGLWRHLVAWLAGLIIAVVVFGLAPAEVISRDAQQQIAYGVICIAGLVVFGAAAVWLLLLWRGRRYRLTIRTMLYVMTASAMLFAVFPIAWAGLQYVADHSPELWLPARGWENISPEVLLATWGLQPATWKWAIVQFIIGHGAYAMVWIALAIVTIWSLLRLPLSIHLRPRLAVLFSTIRTSATAAALVLLAVNLFVAPQMLATVERQYLSDRADLHLATHVAAVQQAMRDVRGEPDTMKWLRESVSAEIAAAPFAE